MKVPPLLLGAALLFWGWQTGFWIVAGVLAALYEGHRITGTRWRMEAAEIRRISDFCTIVFLGMLVYLLFSEQNVYFVFVLIQWIPIALFPLLLAQVYSREGRIDIRALFVVMRKRMQEQDPREAYRMDLTWPYLLLVVIAASAANQRSGGFFAGLVAISLWGLWSVRSRRYPVVLWLAMVAAAAFAGTAGYNGLHRFQLYLEAKGMEWFRNTSLGETNPFQTHTAIGDIGALKPSSRILFRIKCSDPGVFPLTMRQAVYSLYRNARWSVPRSGFREISPGKTRGTWPLTPGGAAEQGTAFGVLTRLSRGNGVLLLPPGARSLTRLTAEKVARNPFGTVKIERRPGVFAYVAMAAPAPVAAGDPSEYDLLVPAGERDVLEALAADLGLAGIAPRQRLARIAAFFSEHFTYTLNLKGEKGRRRPLETFLTTTRSGHCEYFATATVLLLRTAGIPARYVKGYSVHEYSGLEKRWVVRDRHAHAWVAAYVNGAWRDVDTTPSVWAEMEDEAADSFLTTIGDLWSWLRVAVSQWWQSLREEGPWRKLWWLGIPLVVILGRSLKGLRLKRQAGGGESDVEGVGEPPRVGMDSPFYRIEKTLEQGQWRRESWEPVTEWYRRILSLQGVPASFRELEPMIALHCRGRFDPQGISGREKRELSRTVDAWLRACRTSEGGSI